MNLDCISQIILEKNLVTALGTDLFQHHMPDTCKQGILLKLPVGGIPINHYIPGFIKGTFQTIVRSNSHQYGDGQAQALSKALTVQNRVFLDLSAKLLMKIIQCYPKHLPIIYARSMGNEIEWSVTYEIHYLMDL